MLLMETGNWHETRQHTSAFTITRGRKEVIIETSHEIEGRFFENIIIKNEAKGKIVLIFPGSLKHVYSFWKWNALMHEKNELAM